MSSGEIKLCIIWVHYKAVKCTTNQKKIFLKTKYFSSYLWNKTYRRKLSFVLFECTKSPKSVPQNIWNILWKINICLKYIMKLYSHISYYTYKSITNIYFCISLKLNLFKEIIFCIIWVDKNPEKCTTKHMN